MDPEYPCKTVSGKRIISSSQRINKTDASASYLIEEHIEEVVKYADGGEQNVIFQ